MFFHYYSPLERLASEPVGGLMNSKAERLDKAFIERQRRRLMKLRDELVDATQGEEAEEKEVNSQSSGEAEEYEDDAQRLTTLELDGNLVARTCSDSHRSTGHWKRSRKAPMDFPTPATNLYRRKDSKRHRSPSTPWPSRRRVNRRGYEVPVKSSARNASAPR